MEMRVLKKIKWDKIKVGGIFAVNGCWEIHIKVSEDSVMMLATDEPSSECYRYQCGIVMEIGKDVLVGIKDDAYELPMAVKRLFIGA